MKNTPLHIGGITLIPSTWGRVTFAEEVRRRCFAEQPAALAVELPASMNRWIQSGIGRLPEITAVCYSDPTKGSDAIRHLTIDPCDAMIEGLRLGREFDLPSFFVDMGETGLRDVHIPLPCDFVADQAGYEAYCRRVWPFLVARIARQKEAGARKRMARALRALQREYGTILWIGSFTAWPGLVRALREPHDESDDMDSGLDLNRLQSRNPRKDSVLVRALPDSLAHCLTEIPYLVYLYECARESEQLNAPGGFAKLEAIRTIYLEAEKEYQHRHKEIVNLTQWRILMQYTRNLMLLTERYRPDLYTIAMAANGCVDGDYGYETYALAASYPYQELNSGLPEVDFGSRETAEGNGPRRIHPHWAPPPSEERQIRFKRRPSHRMQEIWKQFWDPNLSKGICSWPPEDERQEGFMRYIRQRALQIMSEDRTRVEEFTHSFLDGLDVRETMRNWHTGKIYVRETPMPTGQVGPVVLIFRDETIDWNYSWREALYAEHENESDIAFYADPLGEHVVGPGICYTHFNGIMSVYPANQILNPWVDPALSQYEWCADVLLGAAIMYSEYRNVAYVAHTPPTAQMTALARQFERHIIYMPLAMFAKKALKKVRRFHILDGKHVRQFASEFIDDSLS